MFIIVIMSQSSRHKLIQLITWQVCLSSSSSIILKSMHECENWFVTRLYKLRRHRSSHNIKFHSWQSIVLKSFLIRRLQDSYIILSFEELLKYLCLHPFVIILCCHVKTMLFQAHHKVQRLSFKLMMVSPLCLSLHPDGPHCHTQRCRFSPFIKAQLSQ